MGYFNRSKDSNKTSGDEHPRSKRQDPDTFSRVWNTRRSSSSATRGPKASGCGGTASAPNTRGRGHASESMGVLGGAQAEQSSCSGGGVGGLGPAAGLVTAEEAGVRRGGGGSTRRGKQEWAGAGEGSWKSWRGSEQGSRRGRRGRGGQDWGGVGGGVRETAGMVLFWKRPSCFVQWTPCSFEIYGCTYCNAEQWMMASKARIFGDSETLLKIMNTDDPREQKALGRKVKGFDAVKWERIGYDVVVRGNLEKFRQNPNFLQQLLSTGDKILAEASPSDTEWGIGLHASDDDALFQERWPGKNKLGEALMEVRAQLREDIHQAAAT